MNRKIVNIYPRELCLDLGEKTSQVKVIISIGP